LVFHDANVQKVKTKTRHLKTFWRVLSFKES
jgi:hypothetical protein